MFLFFEGEALVRRKERTEKKQDKQKVNLCQTIFSTLHHLFFKFITSEIILHDSSDKF